MPAHWPGQQAGKDKPLAISPRNWLGNNELAPDQFEAAVGVKNHFGLGTLQPFGLINGKQIGIDHRKFLDGQYWDSTATTTSGSAVKSIAAATATLPPYWDLACGTTAADCLAIVSQNPATLDSATMTTWSPFVCKAGFNITCRARVLVHSTVANTAFFVGLAKLGTAGSSPIHGAANAIVATDYVGFSMPKTNAALKGVVASTTPTETATASLKTIVVDTWYDLEFRVNGVSSVDFYVNGAKTTQTTMTNLPANTTVLGLGASVSTAAGAAAEIYVQTLVAFQEAI